MEHYDLIVIGSGPAGEKGAAQAAYFSKKVALIERDPEIGGAGINTGTAPSKTLREAALYFSGLRQRGLYALGDVILLTIPQYPAPMLTALKAIIRAAREFRQMRHTWGWSSHTAGW